MSVIEKLEADHRAAENALRARKQILGLLRYFDSMAKAQGLGCAIEWGGEGGIVIRVDLGAAPQADLPPLQIAPPDVAAHEGTAPVDELDQSTDAVTSGLKPETMSTVAVLKGPYTPQDQALFEEMVKAGAPSGAIAARLNRSVQSITAKRAHLHRKLGAAERDTKRAVDRRLVADDLPSETAQVVAASPTRAAASDQKRVPATGPAFDDTQPLWKKELTAHLNAVGYADGWTAFRDLSLVTALASGRGLAHTAKTLNVSKAAASSRWGLLNTAPGDIELQTHLIELLRARAEDAA